MDTALRQSEEPLHKIYYSRFRERSVAFLDVQSLEIILRDGSKVKADTLSDVGDVGASDVIYCVNAGEDFVSQMKALEANGWTLSKPYVHHDDKDIASVSLKKLGLTVYITNIRGAYFRGCKSVEDAAAAYHALADIILTNPIGDKFKLLGSAMNTGLELLRVCLPQNQDYSLQSDDVLDLLRKINRQHRIEMLALPSLETVSQCFYLDRRFSYADGAYYPLPVGEPVFDSISDYIPYSVGWYCVDFTIPADWSHIGILPVSRLCDDGLTRWTWPDSPGLTVESAWVSEPELFVAVKAGWPVAVKYRLLWPSTNKAPLRNWYRHVTRMRDEEASQYSEPIRSHLRDALRDMLLKAVGKMASTKDRDLLHLTQEDFAREFSSFDAETRATVEWLDNGLIQVLKPKPKSQYREMFSHPEWTYYIWARTRAAVAQAMLSLPRESLIACRTDAIYTTANPNWPDDGRAGRFRLKGCASGEEVKTPRTIQDLNLLKQMMET